MTETSAWSVGQLKEHFEQLLLQRDKLLDERLRHQISADAAANAALSERLHNLNNFRESLNDAASRNITRAEAESHFKALADKLDTVTKPNWMLLSIAATILLGSIGGVWGLVGLQISNAVNPLGLSLSEIKEAGIARDSVLTEMGQRLRITEGAANKSALADEQSRTDRGQANVRIHDLETQASELAAVRRAETADFKAKLAEIETQFKAITNTHAIFIDNVEQWFAVIYEQVFGKPFPRSTFRPTFHRDGTS